MSTFPRAAPDIPRRTRSKGKYHQGFAPGAAELTLAPAPEDFRLDLSGELDFATTSQLTVLITWLESVHQGVLLDLSAVTFADGAGLGPVLDSAKRRREARLPALVLVGVSREVCRVLDLLADDPGVRALVHCACSSKPSDL